MASEFTPNVNFELQPHGAQLWDEPLRENFRITDQYLAQFNALKVTFVSGLQVVVGPGSVRIGNSIYPFLLPTNLTMIPNTINYIYVNAAGRLSSVSGYPVNSVPLARVLTSASVVLNIVDDRTFFSAGGVAAGVSSIGMVGLTDVVDGNLLFSSSNHINISLNTSTKTFDFSLSDFEALDRKYRVNLTSQIDGLTSLFTLPEEFVAGSEEIFLDGILIDDSLGEYVINGSDQFVIAKVPEVLQTLLVNYNPKASVIPTPSIPQQNINVEYINGDPVDLVPGVLRIWFDLTKNQLRLWTGTESTIRTLG